MESGAALRAKAISAFRSGIRYWLRAAMLGYGDLDCACARELAPSATTSTELANPIIVNFLLLIDSSFWSGRWDQPTIMMRLLRGVLYESYQLVCMLRKQVSTPERDCGISFLVKKLSQRLPDLRRQNRPSGQASRDLVWRSRGNRLACLSGRLHRPNKRTAIRGLPLAPGLAPSAATRSGRTLFFGLIPAAEDPANSFLKRRTPPTPRSET